jgi:hypothetical protein
MDNRERDIAEHALQLLGETLGPTSSTGKESLHALRTTFDERVVARHLERFHGLQLVMGRWFGALRQLAEQSYENRSISFGCVIVPRRGQPVEPFFPSDFLERKRYRALSDGYRTAYRVSSAGELLGFTCLDGKQRDGGQFYPEWAEDLSSETVKRGLALALTRQGDVLVFDRGQMRFTYRFGRWQYWNHNHLTDLLWNAARAQKVPWSSLSDVVRSIYRAALDVSFRRSGALFVLLKARYSLRNVVRMGEAIADRSRDPLDRAFDRVLHLARVQAVKRGLLAEIAGLDGAVVLANNGALLAYGAILEPRRRGRITGMEGSRTKAAIGASSYGLAVKVSSDGDITVYVKGEELIRV